MLKNSYPLPDRALLENRKVVPMEVPESGHVVIANVNHIDISLCGCPIKSLTIKNSTLNVHDFTIAAPSKWSKLVAYCLKFLTVRNEFSYQVVLKNSRVGLPLGVIEGFDVARPFDLISIEQSMITWS